MSKLVVNKTGALVSTVITDCFKPTQMRSGTPTEYTIAASDTVRIVFEGSGFYYDALGFPYVGTARSITFVSNGETIATVTGLKASGADLGDMRTVYDLYDVLGDVKYYASDAGEYVYLTGGNDTIYGFDGNDSLQGNNGDDKVYGGAGDDFFYDGSGKDFADGGSGLDTYSFIYALQGVTIDLTKDKTWKIDQYSEVRFKSIEGLSGSDFKDDLTGTGAANRFYGRGGNDLLKGGGGNDTLDGGAGRDTLKGGDGVDFAMYDSSGEGVTVSLAKKGGQNTGAAGRDVFESIEGLIGSRYDDVLTGSKGANKLQGAFGADTLDGGKGNDSLSGGPGSDLLKGGSGNDRLNGGEGRDTLFGGDGNDTYYFVERYEADGDQITGVFNLGDRINLSEIDANSTTAGTNEAFVFGGQKVSFAGIAGELIWQYSAPGIPGTPILIRGDLNGDKTADFTISIITPANALTADDFVL